MKILVINELCLFHAGHRPGSLLDTSDPGNFYLVEVAPGTLAPEDEIEETQSDCSPKKSKSNE